MNIRDESYKVSRSFGSGILKHTLNSGETWLDGVVITPYGMVAVMSQDDLTRMDTVHKGRHYMRSIERRYTERGLVRMASKFAASLLTRSPR